MLNRIATTSRKIKLSRCCAVSSSSKLARNATSVNTICSYHTTQSRCETKVVLPQKGEVVLPDKIKKIGDEVLALNVLESIMLQQYLRNQAGFDIDVPNPVEAMLKVGLGLNFGPLGGGMAMNPAMMQAMASAQAAPAATQAKEEPKEEEKKKENVKSVFNVKIEKVDEKGKISVIKELRKIDKNLTLKAAKEMVESAPVVIQKDAPKEEAEALKKTLEEMGATVVLE
ncbi:hypothetical protein C9374_004666 [Naegleria lovaniensis]|uniref:Large ribosomal subunit protein bL12 C-terminal domain-containing protein n=1 Tax=Naegleria lovaniensis TaxID=51637 RepID=A0AA88KIX6_NAELO|nr:uncharacterized protein C9374_004666 [Naegleria lovaniensis]KAG2383329.1 hypothetical protein C9374_004666 [Naegleria lovaniensis]